MLARVRQLFAPPIPELAPREAYRLWAENYPPYAHNLLMEVEQNAVWEMMPPVNARRVLDLGCGTGRYATVLRERGADTVGVDLSYEMLERAEDKFARVQADMGLLPLRDECVDVILCGLAVGHVADLPHALEEMARVLNPGGTLVYSDFHGAGGARGWKRTFRAAEQTFAVQHFARMEQQHTRAVRSAGLSLEAVQSVCISPELAHTDKGAETFRAQWGDTPVALIVRARKS